VVARAHITAASGQNAVIYGAGGSAAPVSGTNRNRTWTTMLLPEHPSMVRHGIEGCTRVREFDRHRRPASARA